MSGSEKMTSGSFVTRPMPSPAAQASISGVMLTSATATTFASGMK
jgi:hypothetical protein